MSTISVEESDQRVGLAVLRKQPEMLSLSVLGGIEVAFGGRTIDIRGQKSRALLAYIALSEAGSETRERLVGLLWSESDGNRARGSLRQTLRELRQAFDAVGYRGMHADKLVVALDRAHLNVDIWAAVRQAEQQRVHPLLLNTARLTEALLVGLEDLDPSFRVWLLARRQTLQDRLIRALEAGLTSDAVESQEQGRMAEAIINLDPTHEDACRFVMRIRAQAGDVAGALRIYKTLWDLLDAEYDMEPSAKTQTLVAEIKSGAFDAAEALLSAGPRAAAMPTSASRRAPDAAARLVLTVEPFATDGVSPDQAHIVAGFRHHLIACLVKFREWHVTERAAPAVVDIDGADPAARYKVQVTVYQGGEALHLILSLLEVESERHIWSDRLQLNVGNMFEVQQRIVQRITVALNIQLSTERLIRLAGQPNLPRELYDQWLLGQDLVAKRRPEDWERASTIFGRLIREAPGFGPAYSTLVQLRNTKHIVHPGVFRTEAAQRETLALAKSAARIDPIDSRSQLCLGWAYAFDGQFEQGLSHFDLACDLNDTDPWTLVSSAHAHAFAGDFERAKALAERAIDVAFAPTALHWAYRAAMHFMWGDYEGCIDAADRSQDAAAVTPMWRTAALQRLGRQTGARQEGQRFLEFIRSHWRDGEPLSDDRIGQWVVDLFPIRAASDRERLHGALSAAGLPIAAASRRDR